MIPIRDWMVLEKHKHMDSALVLPDSAEDKADNASAYRIVAVGPGWFEHGEYHETAAFVKPGNIIIMEGMHVPHFYYKGNKYLGGRARDIAFIAEEGESSGD